MIARLGIPDDQCDTHPKVCHAPRFTDLICPVVSIWYELMCDIGVSVMIISMCRCRATASICTRDAQRSRFNANNQERSLGGKRAFECVGIQRVRDFCCQTTVAA